MAGLFEHETTKYDIPVGHLDYGYISTCQDSKELEKIIKVLRSGEEGRYPELEAYALDKLKELHPNSRIFREDTDIVKITDLPSEHSEDLLGDIEGWAKTNRLEEEALSVNKTANGTRGVLYEPPVRGSASVVINKDKEEKKVSSSKSKKRVVPRDYNEWAKLDIDEELKKAEEPKKYDNIMLPKSPKAFLSNRVDASSLNKSERMIRAEMEKIKGNEAFKSCDYEEAVLFYSRSISVEPLPESLNNRGQAYIQMKEWDKAVTDLDQILDRDPRNVKALLRRAVALQAQGKLKKATADLENVLKTEPSNKRALGLLDDIWKASADDQSVQEDLKKISVGKDQIKNAEEHEEMKPGNKPDKVPVQNNTQSDPGDVNIKAANHTEGKEGTKRNKKKQKMPVVKLDKHAKGLKRKHDANPDVRETLDEKDQYKDMPPLERCDSDDDDDDDYGVQAPQRVAVLKTSDKALDKSHKLPVKEQVQQDIMPELPKTVELYKKQGADIYGKGDYGGAMVCFTQAITELKKVGGHQLSLAILLSNRSACRMKLGDNSGCVVDCNEALVLDPISAKPLLRRGVAYENLERYDVAYCDFRAIINGNPNSEVALRGAERCQKVLTERYGRMWRERLPVIPPTPLRDSPLSAETPPAAKSVSSTASLADQAEDEISKEWAEFIQEKEKGNELVKQGDYGGAILHYNRCEVLFPDEAVLYTNRAFCFLHLNEPLRALSDCEVALSRDPKIIKALFRRAQANRMLRCYEESITDLREILKVEKNNPMVKKELKLVQECMQEEEAKLSGRKKLVVEEVENEEEEEEEEEELVIRPRASASKQHIKPSEGKTKSTKSDDAGRSKTDKNMPQAGQRDAPQKDGGGTGGKQHAGSKHGVSDKPAVSPQKKHTKPQHKAQDQKLSDGDLTGKGQADTGRPASSQNSATVPSVAAIQKNSSSSIADPGPNNRFPGFMKAWRQVPRDGCGIESYLDILVCLDPCQVPRAISYELQGNVLMTLIRCLEHFSAQGEVERAFQYLEYIPRIERFGINAMFLNKQEKQEVGKLLAGFRLNLDKSRLADVDRIAKMFNL